MLANEFGITAKVYSATSFNELARDGYDVERYNMLHPDEQPKQAYITQVLSDAKGPTVAATDYMKQYADQVRAWVPTPYKVLGTDGFGRSDSRDNLRRHFEVSAEYVVIAALSELAKAGTIDAKVVAKAIADYGIDTNKINPLYA